MGYAHSPDKNGTLTREEQRVRNRVIAQRMLLGRPVRLLTQLYGLSPERCRQITYSYCAQMNGLAFRQVVSANQGLRGLRAQRAAFGVGDDG